MGRKPMTSGPDEPDFIDGGPRIANKADTICYLIEIIDELREMAERGGYRTLAAVLKAALVEARVQSEEHDR
jgi:hypothetical protein